MIAQVHADTMNMVLKGAVENGTGHAARLFGREVAGKTGTTSDYTDARFVGYTPNLVTSVWLGFDKPQNKLVGVRGLAGGVRRVAAGPDLARLHGPGHPQPAHRAVRAPGRPGRLVLNPTTTAPPATVPPTTQPGQNPPPTFPSPTQPGPSVPPTSLGLPGPGPDPTTPA